MIVAEARTRTFEERFILHNEEYMENLNFAFYNETPVEFDGQMCKLTKWRVDYGPEQTTVVVHYVPV